MSRQTDGVQAGNQRGEVDSASLHSPVHEVIELAPPQCIKVCIAAYALEVSEAALEDRLKASQGRLPLPQPRVAAGHIVQRRLLFSVGGATDLPHSACIEDDDVMCSDYMGRMQVRVRGCQDSSCLLLRRAPERRYAPLPGSSRALVYSAMASA